VFWKSGELQKYRYGIHFVAHFVSFLFKLAHSCKPGWYTYNNFCYKVSDELTTFNQANLSCINEGAVLIFIEDLDELDFLDTILADGQKVFVGMTDIAKEGQWVWMNGSAVTLDPLWHGKFPAGGTKQNCAEYVQNHGFHDRSCDVTRKYVCKYSLLDI